MTRNESFKRRVRARMAKTGEKYGAARRVLIEHAGANGQRTWVSDPEQSDAAVRKATGRGWDEWCDLVDAWPGHHEGRREVTAWLQDEHGLTGWWAMSVTLGWERITGRRLPGQRPDGTFSAARSATITTPFDREFLAVLAGRARPLQGRTSRPARPNDLAVVTCPASSDRYAARTGVRTCRMITLADIRTWATALPEVAEQARFGRPGFRMLFASVNLDDANPNVIVHVDQPATAGHRVLRPLLCAQSPRADSGFTPGASSIHRPSQKYGFVVDRSA